MGVAMLSAAPAGAVAYGQAVPQGTYPFAAKLTLNGIPRPDGTTYDSACSGGLIAQQWVITAGHCFHDANRVRVSGPPPYANATATLGTTDTTVNPGEARTIVDVAQSPDSDVALARLDTPVTDIAPLDISNQAPTLGEQLTLAGWGWDATPNTTPTPSTSLRSGVVGVGTVTDLTIGVHGVYPSSFTSACIYDSGAPYFVPQGATAGTLVSVELSGPACPHDQLETTSRVDVLTDWISQTTGTGPGSSPPPEPSPVPDQSRSGDE
jgi:hypothetical protein